MASRTSTTSISFTSSSVVLDEITSTTSSSRPLFTISSTSSLTLFTGAANATETSITEEETSTSSVSLVPIAPPVTLSILPTSLSTITPLRTDSHASTGLRLSPADLFGLCLGVGFGVWILGTLVFILLFKWKRGKSGDRVDFGGQFEKNGSSRSAYSRSLPMPLPQPPSSAATPPTTRRNTKEMAAVASSIPPRRKSLPPVPAFAIPAPVPVLSQQPPSLPVRHYNPANSSSMDRIVVLEQK